jgi:hypothetical protein
MLVYPLHMTAKNLMNNCYNYSINIAIEYHGDK